MSRRWGSGGEEPLLLRDVLLEDVGLQRAVEVANRRPLALGRDEVHAEDRHRRATDRHRRRDIGKRDAGEQDVHVSGTVDGHSAVADLAQRSLVVRVMPHQGRHVEGDGQAAAALGEDRAIALVGLLGVAEAGELTNRPRPAAVPTRVQPTSERVFPRPADPIETGVRLTRRRPVDGVHL